MKTTEELDVIDEEIRIIEEKVYALNEELAELRKKRARRSIPDYVFQTQSGEITLSALFGEKQDLALIHNMGKQCSVCTMWADGFNATYKHIEKHAAFVVLNHDDVEVQKEFAESRNWTFRMVSAKHSPFTKDMGFWSEKYILPGISVFHRNTDGSLELISQTGFGPGDEFFNVPHVLKMLAKPVGMWD